MNCLKHLSDECKSCSGCQDEIKLDLLQALDLLVETVGYAYDKQWHQNCIGERYKSEKTAEVSERAKIFLSKFGLNK